MQQNRYYWLILSHLSESLLVPEYDTAGEPTGRRVQHSADTWAKYFRARYLGWEDTRLPNGTTVTELRHTPDTDVAAFSTYLDQIIAWCHDHNIVLPPPAEEGGA